MHLISLDDISVETLRRLLAGERSAGGPERPLVALLDFLPLGPEGLALRAAAARLGAELIEGARLFTGFPDRVDLLDAVRAAGAYADAVVLRHPLKGAARAAAAVAEAPVLNAGDGTGEDPLFALGDLTSLSDSLGGLGDRTVALCGDLLRNRRVHSLAGGLIASGGRVLLVPAKGAEPPDAVLDRLSRTHGYHPVSFRARSMSSLLSMVDSWLLTPDLDHQLSLLPDLVASSDRERRLVRHQVKEVHAMWVAAPRDDTGEPDAERREEGWPFRPEDGRAFLAPSKPHEEVPGCEVPDWAGRAPAEIRSVAAALSLAMDGGGGRPFLPDDVYLAAEGVRCVDSGCIACREPVRVPPAFVTVRTDPVILTCMYCWSRRRVRYVASRVEKRFHPLTSAQVRKILPRNTVFFANRRDAEAAGFVSSKI